MPPKKASTKRKTKPSEPAFSAAQAKGLEKLLKAKEAAEAAQRTDSEKEGPPSLSRLPRRSQKANVEGNKPGKHYLWERMLLNWF